MTISRYNIERREQELNPAAGLPTENFEVDHSTPEDEAGRSRIYPEHWMIAAIVCCAFVVAIVRLTNLA